MRRGLFGVVIVLAFLGVGARGQGLQTLQPTDSLQTRRVKENSNFAAIVAAIANKGTVTSVGVSAPASLFSLGGQPVTTSGTVSFSLINQAPHTFFAGPASGGSGQPAFRLLIPSDLPALPVFVGSGSSHASGAVPDPGPVAGIARFVREDGTWSSTFTQPTILDAVIGQLNNGDDIISSMRSTDSSPTGNFLHFRKAAGPDLFVTDINGVTTVSRNSLGTTPPFGGFTYPDAIILMETDPGILLTPRRFSPTIHYVSHLWNGTADNAVDVRTYAGGFNSIGQYNIDISVGGGTSSNVWSVDSTGMASSNVFNAATGFQIGLLAASGHYLRGNGTNYVDSTLLAGDLPVFGASGGSHAPGAVPDPGATAGTTHWLREDKSWALLPVMGASGSGHQAGLVPDPGATAGTTRFLREDQTFAVPPVGVTPGGSSGQVQSNNGSGGLSGATNLTISASGNPVAAATAAPGSPVAGEEWNDSTQQAIGRRLGGVNQFVSTTLFTLTADNSVSGTTSPTSVISSGVQGTTTLPASFLAVGKTIQVTLVGTVLTSGALTPSARVKVNVGGTNVYDSGSGSFKLVSDANTYTFTLTVLLTCRTTGSSGTVAATANLTSAAAVSGASSNSTLSATLNTTVSNALDVTVTPNSSSITLVVKEGTAIVAN